MEYFEIVCELCSCRARIDRGIVEKIPLSEDRVHNHCEQGKNGYCAVFRLQAILDQKDVNMAQPKNPHYEEIRGKF